MTRCGSSGRNCRVAGKKIAEFATESLPSFVTAVGAADGTWDAFAAADALPSAVLFTTKDATTPLYKALSLRFKVGKCACVVGAGVVGGGGLYLPHCTWQLKRSEVA